MGLCRPLSIILRKEGVQMLKVNEELTKLDEQAVKEELALLTAALNG